MRSLGQGEHEVKNNKNVHMFCKAVSYDYMYVTLCSATVQQTLKKLRVKMAWESCQFDGKHPIQLSLI